MPYTPISHVAELSYPKRYLDDLKHVGPLLISSMERDGLPIESGSINIGEVEPRVDIALFFFHWISEINSVIENINIAVADLKVLHNNYIFLDGCPEARYHLLVRTYFHEFYRFREIYSQIVKAAADRSYIQKEEISGLRKSFHEAFKETIELRNSLVHGAPLYKGKKHFDLNLVVSCWKRGMELKDPKTGEVFELRDALEIICQSSTKTLIEEGNRMSNLMQNLVDIFSEHVSGI